MLYKRYECMVNSTLIINWFIIKFKSATNLNGTFWSEIYLNEFLFHSKYFSRDVLYDKCRIFN